MKHLFLSDIDGTLMRRDVPLLPSVISAAEEYKKHGGLLAICTGRSLPAAQAVALELGVNAPSILYGGAAIYDFQNRKYLYANPFTWDVLIGVKSVLENEPAVSMQVLTLENVYVLRRNQRLNERGVKEENVGPVVPIEDVKGAALKLVMCCDDPKRLEACRPYFPPEFCNFSFGSRTFVDIVPAGHGKGEALKALSQLTGVSFDHFFSAGDAMSDVPMMKLSGTSFAPENAMDEVKKVATHIVPDITQGGMGEAFRIAAKSLHRTRQ